MFKLEAPEYLYLLFILPILAVGLFSLLWWRSYKQKAFATETLFKKLSPDHSYFKTILKWLVIMIALFFIIIALANPKLGTRLETVKREGVDVVFAIDVSKSMLTEDIAPNRLEKAKRIVSEIINQLAGDRIGIIAYAGSAFPQLPITTDYASAKMFLQNMDTDMLSSQGTAIDQAIKMAESYYDDAEQTNKILVIISDGEDHSEGSEDMASQAAQKGIRIFTIGVGSSKGDRIPLKENGIVKEYKKDEQGEVVISKLDQAILMKIAERGDGSYIDGTNTQMAVEYITQLLLDMDKTEFESKQVVEYEDQFQWFVGAALLFLLLDVFFLERRTAWLRKLNLFNEQE